MEGQGYQFAQGENNSWKLCKAHCGCKKCQKTLASYKRKANKHSYNAQRLKYALMCFLEGDTTEHQPGNEGVFVNLVPIEDDPVFVMEEDNSVEDQKKENELYNCGVCCESMVKVGKKKPIIFGCGHSNCAECFNQWCQTNDNRPECPYCRVPITKAIRLFTNA
jgi:hypothetical protein